MINPSRARFTRRGAVAVATLASALIVSFTFGTPAALAHDSEFGWYGDSARVTNNHTRVKVCDRSNDGYAANVYILFEEGGSTQIATPHNTCYGPRQLDRHVRWYQLCKFDDPTNVYCSAWHRA
jgi:hypothetical protein